MVQQSTYTATRADIYTVATSKQVLVSKDTVFVRKDVLNGQYIGQKPENYIWVAAFLCFINPVCGPIALVFAMMSSRSYYRGDLRYAEKWGQYSMTACMLIFIFTVFLYIAIGFTLSPIGINGGHSFGM